MYQFIKCRCHGVRFSKMKELAQQKGLTTVAELQRHLQFGDNCRRCVPFVRQMLETGQTEFVVAEADTFEDVPNPELETDSAQDDYGDEDEL